MSRGSLWTLAISALGIGCLGTANRTYAQAAPSAFTWATRYDATGKVVGTIAPDPDGAGSLKYAAVRNTYDAAGRLIKVERGELATWQSESVAPSSWPSFTVFASTETDYDVLDRKTAERSKGSDGIVSAVTQYSYDSAGRLGCTAVRMNPALFGSLPPSACTLGTQGAQVPDRITMDVYDAAGQLVQVREAVGTTLEEAEATYSYTANGKQEYVIDAVGNRAKLEYDGFDRQIKWIFSSPTKAPSFDPTSQTTALSTAGAINTSDYEQYGYDADGNRTSFKKRDGSILTYQYDALNRMTVKIVPERSGLAATHTRDVYYGYDEQGHQLYARFDSTTGEGITNLYDGFGRMTSATTAIDGINRTLSYQYDADGDRTRITHPGGAYFTTTYDGLDRFDMALCKVGAANTQFVDIDYNAQGLRSTIGRVGSYTDYSYQPDQKLASLTQRFAGNNGNVTQGFAYNPAGQVTSSSTSNDAFAWTGYYSVDRPYATNGLNQYTTGGPATLTYDANGDLIYDGSTTLVYDVENRLVNASGAHVATLRYDPLGRLWEVATSASTKTRIVYDGDHAAIEYNASGAMVRRYYWGPGEDEPMLWDEGSALNCTGTYLLHANAQGSIVALADCSGNQVAIDRYDEYGIPQTTPANFGEFQYTGQSYVTALGMYYYKARFYSATLGRFLQTDPVGYDDQVNLYAYVANDPVNKTDPTGNEGDGPGIGHNSASFGEALEEGLETSAKEVAAEEAIGGGPEDPIADVVAVVTIGVATYQAYHALNPGPQTAATPRAAARTAMRQAGIPTSQQPSSQGRNASGRFRQYDVPKRGGGTERKAVVESRMDRSHPGQPHVEAGRVKTDPVTGQTRNNNYGAPRLQNGKAKVDVTGD